MAFPGPSEICFRSVALCVKIYGRSGESIDRSQPVARCAPTRCRRGHARPRPEQGALDHILGAAVAATRLHRHRGRPVPRGILGWGLAVAAADRRGPSPCSYFSSSPPRRRGHCISCGFHRAPTVCAGLTARPDLPTARRPRLPTIWRRRRPILGRLHCGAPTLSAHSRPPRSLKAGMAGAATRRPRSVALRALVLVLLLHTFFAAGGERGRRIAAAFDWQGVMNPANFRVDAWVSPPTYTNRPPIILPGVRPGEHGQASAVAISVPVGSALVIRASGKTHWMLLPTGGLPKPQVTLVLRLPSEPRSDGIPSPIARLQRCVASARKI